MVWQLSAAGASRKAVAMLFQLGNSAQCSTLLGTLQGTPFIKCQPRLSITVTINEISAISNCLVVGGAWHSAGLSTTRGRRSRRWR